jgi:hypothetical protein
MPMSCTAHSYPGPARRVQPAIRRGIAVGLKLGLAVCLLSGLALAVGAGRPAFADSSSSAPRWSAPPPRIAAVTAAVTAGQAAAGSASRSSPTTVDRRQVAVIDLLGDEEAGAVGRTLAAQLVRHRELAPLADPAIAAIMIGPIFDEDNAAIESARRALADADDAMTRFELSVAAARAAAGQAELNNVQPTAAAMTLYAELAFVLGRAKLSEGDRPAARSSFLLTQRLMPDFVPDPTRYLPDVIDAFRQARRSGGGRVSIQIRGQGTAYLDGQSVGTAPVTVDSTPGAHVVHLFAPGRLSRGTRIEVTPSSPAVVVLPDARASLSVNVARGRRAAIAAVDPIALTTAVAQLARLIGVSDVVVISRSTDGALTLQAWRDRPPGAGMIHPASEGDAVGAALIDLSPLVIEVLAPTSPIISGPEREPSWYRRRWVQASIVTGALAVIATALVLNATGDEGTVPLDPDPTF